MKELSWQSAMENLPMWMRMMGATNEPTVEKTRDFFRDSLAAVEKCEKLAEELQHTSALSQTLEERVKSLEAELHDGEDGGEEGDDGGLETPPSGARTPPSPQSP